MRSVRTPKFKALYQALPEIVRKQADEAYRMWKKDPFHPSLQFKLVDNDNPPLWSVRVNKSYRALGTRDGDVMTWLWIGSHREYEKRI